MATVKPKKPRNRMAQDINLINKRKIDRRLAVLERQMKFLLTRYRLKVRADRVVSSR